MCVYAPLTREKSLAFSHIHASLRSITDSSDLDRLELIRTVIAIGDLIIDCVLNLIVN